ncbi:SGNH/GDSL hydrolase family protein [Clostridium vincentii]|uniref:SGNH hydrolase-type esterase domain-containing protein n=1 Tax=Clostridium vincentii TaxID=52704 RepID=A0A2T0BCZ0_9CLOT|nr:SGNH/GDSL hydrolase family protein [Clostridium vincentii]PRR81751.1 hypothetical protein CLVI_22400 [Clostridium vincentii]
MLNKLQIYKSIKATGEAIVLLQEYDMGFTVDSIDICTIEIEKIGRGLNITVHNADFTKYFTIFREATPKGFISYPLHTYGFDQGTLQGKTVIAAVGGDIKILSFTQYLHAKKYPKLYIIGDSITEAFGVNYNEGFSSLIQQRLGVNDCVISGVAGASLTSAFTRMQQDLNSIQPTNCLMFLGTNYQSDYATKIAEIKTYLFNKGIELYICTVPTQKDVSDYIKTLTGVTIIDLYNAFNTNDVINQDYYTNTDTLGNVSYDVHPNGVGHAKIISLVKQSAKEILV